MEFKLFKSSPILKWCLDVLSLLVFSTSKWILRTESSPSLFFLAVAGIARSHRYTMAKRSTPSASRMKHPVEEICQFILIRNILLCSGHLVELLDLVIWTKICHQELLATPVLVHQAWNSLKFQHRSGTTGSSWLFSFNGHYVQPTRRG